MQKLLRRDPSHIRPCLPSSSSVVMQVCVGVVVVHALDFHREAEGGTVVPPWSMVRSWATTPQVPWPSTDARDWWCAVGSASPRPADCNLRVVLARRSL